MALALFHSKRGDSVVVYSLLLVVSLIVCVLCVVPLFCVVITGFLSS